jgi:hypothetical protein
MAFKEYDGLSTDQAMAKLRAKSFHDEEDKAFARARADLLSPEELAAITGDEMPEKKQEAKAPVGNDADQTPSAPVAGDVELVDEKLKLDELQAIAAESNLDTSGKKADLIERINAFRKSK